MKNSTAYRMLSAKNFVRLKSREVIFLLVAILSAGTVQARDLRYCLAVDPNDRITMFSEIFESDLDLDSIATAFSRTVAGKGQPHQSPACPRSDDIESARQDRFRAIEYNRSLGRQTIIMDWRYR